MARAPGSTNDRRMEERNRRLQERAERRAMQPRYSEIDLGYEPLDLGGAAEIRAYREQAREAERIAREAETAAREPSRLVSVDLSRAEMMTMARAYLSRSLGEAYGMVPTEPEPEPVVLRQQVPTGNRLMDFGDDGDEWADAVQPVSRDLEEENRALRQALEDAINSPKGVVPASAEQFWDGQAGRVRR